MRLRQRAAHDGEVLGENIDDATVDRAPAGDDAVARHFRLFHAEFGATVLDVHVEFFERAVVHQKLDALARGQLALGMLSVDPGAATAETGIVAALLQLVDDIFHGTPCPARAKYAERAL